MISGLVVDTDVVSFIFKGDTRGDLYRPHLAGQLSVISFMTIAELERWALQHQWGITKRNNLEVYLHRHIITYSDRDLCHKWAQAIVSARRNGRPIRTADAWIAATALLHGMPLLTHNRSNYLGVDGLSVVSEAP
ncbi:MAG TPA: PIN domain-containing protein [Blastocatellia bacterium]|nr:PIN domain-containing protein [Blastocatellia bacterium]